MTSLVKKTTILFLLITFFCAAHATDWTDRTPPARLPHQPFMDAQLLLPAEYSHMQGLVKTLVTFVRSNKGGDLRDLFYEPSLKKWRDLCEEHGLGRQTNLTLVEIMDDMKASILTALKKSQQIILPTNAHFFLTILIDRGLTQIYTGAWGSPLPFYAPGPTCIVEGYSPSVFADLIASYRHYDCWVSLQKALLKEKETGDEKAYFYNLRRLFTETMKTKLPNLLAELRFESAGSKVDIILRARLLLLADPFCIWDDVESLDGSPLQTRVS